MSSTPFAATVELAPRPSVRALTLLFGLHAAVLVLLMIALPPGWPMAIGAVPMAVSWLTLRRHPVFGFGPRALTRLTWHVGGAWTIHDASGMALEAELQGDSLVLPYLLVLNFKVRGDGRRTRALLGDELEPEPLRRLRARLSIRK
jgi:toxin CptA